jgi:hypothetical protein
MVNKGLIKCYHLYVEYKTNQTLRNTRYNAIIRSQAETENMMVKNQKNSVG